MSPGSRNNSFSEKQKSLSGKKPRLLLRARMIQAIRRFFIEHNYLEVETPQLISAPAPEAHIDAVGTGNSYLHTSPELCMKRLLAAGFKEIFQISKCFREEEKGDLHLPEFTLLEWYRTGIDYKELMEECEALFLSVSQDLGMMGKLYRQGVKITLNSPWERLSVSAAFDRYASLSLETAIEKNCFDKVMVEEIEPRLGMSRPTFLYDYPASMAALARLSPQNRKVAERFEIYIAGVELANGFSELTDAVEQRARFENELQQRKNMGKHVCPMPEIFLKSLEYMPKAAGIALGVDRLAMIFTDSPRINNVVSFSPADP